MLIIYNTLLEDNKFDDGVIIRSHRSKERHRNANEKEYN
jgi:hypothetical protein